MTDRYDIVIVGAGHNGLTAAFYLARAGLRTLVLERRELVGGACVTEEIAPGVRASTTSYIASMLRPEIVADLGLAERGLRMVPCEPGLQVVFEDRPVLPWWSTHERTAEEIRRISGHDADAFGRVTERLHELARSLQPFFLEEAPNLYATGWSKLREGRRLFRRFRHLSGDQLSDWCGSRPGRSASSSNGISSPTRSAASTWRTTSTGCTRPRTDREPRSGSCSTCSPAASTTSRASTAT
jgi:phytoene dehydrogenase-like protein